jgi:hypothetical protein
MDVVQISNINISIPILLRVIDNVDQSLLLLLFFLFC